MARRFALNGMAVGILAAVVLISLTGYYVATTIQTKAVVPRIGPAASGPATNATQVSTLTVPTHAWVYDDVAGSFGGTLAGKHWVRFE